MCTAICLFARCIIVETVTISCYSPVGVTCLAVHDVLLDGVPDVLVGRDDGIVQLYSFDESEEPVLKFSHVRT